MKAFVLAIGVAATLVPNVGYASHSSDARAWTRCQRSLPREGFSYGHGVEWRLSRCADDVSDCQGASNVNACIATSNGCGRIASDLAWLNGRLSGHLASACGGVSVTKLLDDWGYRSQLPGCSATSIAGFANCFAAQLRSEIGAVSTTLTPSLCDLLTKSGVAKSLPAEFCSAPSPGSGGGGGGGSCDATLYCGGPDSVTCPSGFACDRSDALCTTSGPSGKCVPLPASCTNAGAPVCGCDGVTYASDCDRLRAGVTLARTAACDPAPVACNFANATCPAGFFCDFPPGDCGEGGTGACRPVRSEPCDLCTAFVDGPVCGCDAVTYPSECARAGAGVSKAWSGSCS